MIGSCAFTAFSTACLHDYIPTHARASPPLHVYALQGITAEKLLLIREEGVDALRMRTLAPAPRSLAIT